MRGEQREYAKSMTIETLQLLNDLQGFLLGSAIYSSNRQEGIYYEFQTLCLPIEPTWQLWCPICSDTKRARKWSIKKRGLYLDASERLAMIQSYSVARKDRLYLWKQWVHVQSYEMPNLEAHQRIAIYSKPIYSEEQRGKYLSRSPHDVCTNSIILRMIKDLGSLSMRQEGEWSTLSSRTRMRLSA